MAARFPELDNEDLMNLLDDRLSDRSKNAVKYSVRLLSSYATSRNGVVRWTVEEMPAASLDTYLSRFYAELRKKVDLCTRKVLLLLCYRLKDVTVTFRDEV